MTEIGSDKVHPRLRSLWLELLDKDEVTEQSDFFDDGGTSITAVYLAASIQETFGVLADAIEVVQLRTFGEIARLVSERQGAKTSAAT
jgi:acyl carrier protein